MKKVVKILTLIALFLLMAGGSALDSENMMVPVIMIVPSLLWFGAIAIANRA